ncbi:DUF2442 domain-containing protein [Rudanella paleaurantiibacter]|uniref:DUF2442 domain-containing protein n=1 Tax=Rudanella paleaurantiibacter TaxID=2614655 RepID=A0A7J5TZ56_9BACT|nr:DUF2442 domain-containing protein [Rudanella paleaurantiibacter]KAB7729186.1 DUF2442 domain-containing protein [Rudanella paleaurantiibacter]
MRTALNPATRNSPKAKSSNPALDILPEHLPDLSAVNVTESLVVCRFEDGRSVSFPLDWSDKLAKATTEQRQAFEFNAHFIFWDDLDEIIGVRNILLGNKLRWS